METIESRLKKLIMQRYGSLKAFTEKIGMPWTTLDSILKRGVLNSSVSNVLKISQELDIDLEKLAEGDIIDNQSYPITLAAHADEELTDEDLEEVRQIAEFIAYKKRKDQGG